MNLRKPRDKYKNTNGFAGSSLLSPSGISDAEAADRQDLAHFAIEELGTHFPSYDAMKEIVEAPPSLAAVKARITQLTDEYRKHLAKLYQFRLQDIKQDALDSYLQRDDLKYFDDTCNDPDWHSYYNQLEALFRSSPRIDAIEFNGTIERFRYEYLRMMLPLYRQRAELERAEEEARINRAAQFPLSLQQYHSMDVRAAQLRVARFLMADAAKREQMMTESRWAYRQTRPLIMEFEQNFDFKIEIQKMVQEVESRDPRLNKRPAQI